MRRYAADGNGPRPHQKNPERRSTVTTEQTARRNYRPTDARERIDGVRPTKAVISRSRNTKSPDNRQSRPERRRNTAVCGRPRRPKAAQEKYRANGRSTVATAIERTSH
eukprot:jgi/Undpi1/9319/HiC_scaffold_26.g11777.m1